MIYLKPTTAGFSLVETLVAISILLIVIAGPMSITARTAKSSTFATEQAQAFFLAQEGIELAQKARDDLFLGHFSANTPPNPWANFTDSSGGGTYRHCFVATVGCRLEWSTTAGALVSPPSTCSSGCLLYRPATAGRAMFTYDSSAGNIATLFTRRIFFEAVGNNSIKVRSEVTWRTGSLVSQQRVEVVTYLYNVYNRP